MKFTRLHLVFCLLILPLPITALQAANELQAIEAEADGRILFRFDGAPTVAASALSTQKTRISLRISNCNVRDDARNVPGAGPVERIFVQRDDNDAMIYIELRQRGGYSLAVLPYSAQLRLYVVDWLQMDAADEHFHSGLLALESGARSAALNEFGQAGDHADAAAMSGILHMQSGNAAAARTQLERALRLNSSFPDVYAGLSSLERADGNSKRAAALAGTFFERSGRDSIATLFKSAAAAAPAFSEPLTLAADIVLPGRDTLPGSATIAPDSAANLSTSDSARADLPALALSEADTAGRGPSEFALRYGMPRQARSDELKSLMPGWIKWAAAGITVVAVFGGIGVAVFYFRWRRKKMAGRPRAAAPGSEFEAMVREALAAEDDQSAADHSAEDVDGGRSAASSNADPVDSLYAPKPDAEWLAALDDTSPLAAGRTKAGFGEAQSEVSAGESSVYAAEYNDTTDVGAQGEQPQVMQDDDRRQTIKSMHSSGAALDMARTLGRSRMQSRLEHLADVDAAGIPDGRLDRAAMARDLGVTAGELQIKQALGRLEGNGEAGSADKLAAIFGTRTGSNLKNS